MTSNPSTAGEKSPRRLPGWARASMVFAVLAGGVAFLLLGGGASEAFVYSKLVHEVAARPGAFEGRQLRVEGELRQGSIQFRAEPCEWRFVLTDRASALPVRFPQCVVPDTFRDGMGIRVTVQGAIHADGTFVANQVVPRCPSKYEMDHQKLKGGVSPHRTVTREPSARSSL